ncbi:ATP-binding protein [Klebsiella michiganensis]|uniref:ATP-binding protein n=1 Tax=Klebsiella/Raoultella group TaxID=2890311 RepID=UPI002246D5B9|nr:MULTISPECIES: ATP-binding protein [Klebsiella/Raoultella group]MCW9670011.1 ATP-binding protein [Klebsiella michiganensis]MCZ0883458.1 ATP-binding protein [Raoultella ornithinolytica]MDV1097403.1 ATP-binding protein [Raoultella ornithinolytica]HDH7803676.1 AAA family ATPase [Raoultella ornithinolytica]HDH7835919.1 AAA family ATPase [Raoultella ornithinolytica]
MILFIAGAHAVGKSYLCKKFLENHNVDHHSASSLIAKGRVENWGIDKKTGNAEENQKILIEQLASFKHNKQDLLLDGHFVLVSKENQFIELDHSVFHEMGINGIILVESDETTIIKRFKEREANLSFSPRELMTLERKNAIAVTKELNIPLVILNTPSKECFSDVIESILS